MSNLFNRNQTSGNKNENKRTQNKTPSTEKVYSSQYTSQNTNWGDKSCSNSYGTSSKNTSFGNETYPPIATEESQRVIDERRKLLEWKKVIENKIHQLECNHEDYINKQIQLETKLVGIITELTNDHRQRIGLFSDDILKCQQDMVELKQAVGRNQSSIKFLQGNQADKQTEEYKHKREKHMQEITSIPTFNELVTKSVTETHGATYKDPPKKPIFTPSHQGNVLSSSTKLHVGFAGSSGAGKSSLINAIRGLKPSDADAALVDDMPIERINKYEFYKHDGALVLCDIPNMDYDSSEVERYFEAYKLEQLNLLIIVFAERLMETDALMAKFAVDHKISFILVRTKSDRAIESKMEQKGLSVTEATTELRKQTQETSMSKLDLVGICDEEKKKIYCVSTRGFVGTQEQQEKFKMDEDMVVSVIGALKNKPENNF